MGTIWHNPLRAILAMLCMLIAVACSEAGALPEAALADPAESVLLGQPSRYPAGSGQYPAWCSGAEYASDLPHGACAADGDALQFSPDWSGGLSGAAYAVYRLGNGPDLLEPALKLNWQMHGPAVSTSWLGFSHWASDSWEWHNIPARRHVHHG